MSMLALLFQRQPLRHFALLDAQGVCRALRQAHRAPSEAGWVEVRACRPSWLQQPLPADARLDGCAGTRDLAA
ncbi:hypothetical protein JQX08_05530 [Pseudomonas sp. UL073]|uniref:Uncharacterized protein n=1 Tax=Zestomonas insulae TaxID=2809017 RepID=A0ABS2IBX0_9GAMM|nr:hypothetical protein [Pseudomonas insulae]MBM7060163.1 hypothetical protein [Pseudomonas insulae]